jgi:hypothetical protein
VEALIQLQQLTAARPIVWHGRLIWHAESEGISSLGPETAGMQIQCVIRDGQPVVGCPRCA